jgi:hypothetical protein
MSIEYRICWAASSDVSFHGHSRWREWDDPDASDDDVQEALSLDDGRICDGLDAALDASGFDWWVETRTLGSEEAA